MPFFSIIIPTYNRRGLLQQALDSVWAQTFTDYEVIVVDDGSTDGTVDYLRSMSERIQLLIQANRGAGIARNAGAVAAKGGYLAFLDSDDLWFPWTLDIYQKVVLRYASPSFITGMPIVFTTAAETSRTDDEDLLVESFSDYYESSDEWRWFSASSFVIRRDAFDEVKGFNEEWGAEDAHLAMKLGCSSGFVHIQRPYTFAYRTQENSLMAEKDYLSTGAKVLIASERNGEFPGGAARSRERQQILTRHIRPVTLHCLRNGVWRDAWALYWATFWWHVRFGRWKYLVGFPVKALTGT